MLALTVSLAYFIYDTICCAVELPFSWEMLIHHALTILGLAYGYVRQVVSPSNAIQRLPTILRCCYAHDTASVARDCMSGVMLFDCAHLDKHEQFN
jgi:hypothetical protein